MRLELHALQHFSFFFLGGGGGGDLEKNVGR